MDDITSTNDSSSSRNSAFWIDFVAGWCAGAAGVVLVQPVDTLLTRYQAGLQSSVVSTTMGLRNLYKGAWPMIWTVPLQNMLLMGGYGVGQSYYENQQHQSVDSPSLYHKYTAIFISGSIGGVAQSFLMSPVELVKIQRQCQAPSLMVPAMANGTSAVATSSTAVWSVPARGLGATLLRDGLPHGIWFVAYQACKDYMEDQHYGGAVATPLTSGAFAATVAWGIGYPADVIKTRIQYASSETGILEMARLIVKESGGSWRGLYKGFGWKLVRAIPASMVGFGVYEMVKYQVLERLQV